MQRTLITIVTESILERQLVEDILRLGAHGYTVTEARGEGSRGVRSAEWEHSSNIRLETVCEEGVAEVIREHLARTYYQHYAMVVYSHPVEVTRGDKF